jgi:uncharacterized membrane protein
VESKHPNWERRIIVSDLLTIIAVVLIILWLLGIVTSYTIGGFIHLLLVIAIITILIRVISRVAS